MQKENHIIGNNLRHYRIKAGFTHKDLSKRIYKTQGVNIKPAALRNYEAGGCAITAICLSQIASTLGRELNEFYDDCLKDNLPDKHGMKLLEAFYTIKRQSVKEAMLHIMQMLAKR